MLSAAAAQHTWMGLWVSHSGSASAAVGTRLILAILGQIMGGTIRSSVIRTANDSTCVDNGSSIDKS